MQPQGANVSSCVCAEMIHDWEVYSVQQDIDPEEKRRNFELVQQMLSWMRQLDVSQQLPVAKNESTEAHDCENNNQHLHTQIQPLQAYTADTHFLPTLYSCHDKEHIHLQLLLS